MTSCINSQQNRHKTHKQKVKNFFKHKKKSKHCLNVTTDSQKLLLEHMKKHNWKEKEKKTRRKEMV